MNKFQGIESSLQEVTITTNGVKLHVVQAGPEDGKPIILLHGFPEFWYGWHNQIDHLVEQGYRLWIPDQRGYNLSEKPKGTSAYKVENLVNDVVGLIDHIGVEKIPIIAHDWGGLVAWWTALMHPDRVEQLAVLNVPHPKVFERAIRRNFLQWRRLWYVWFFQIPRLPEFMLSKKNFETALNTLTKTSNPNTFTPDELKLYREAFSQPDEIHSIVNWYRALIQCDRPEPKDWRLQMPTIVMWGKHDHHILTKLAQESIELCDDGKLIIIPNGTHWVHHESPHLVNNYLTDFLGGVEIPASPIPPPRTHPEMPPRS